MNNVYKLIRTTTGLSFYDPELIGKADLFRSVDTSIDDVVWNNTADSVINIVCVNISSNIRAAFIHYRIPFTFKADTNKVLKELQNG